MRVAGRLIYKCRLCGVVYAPTGVPNVTTAMISVVNNTPIPTDWDDSSYTFVKTLEIHACGDGRIGLSDLIGAERYIVEEAK